MTHPRSDAYLEELRTALEMRDASDSQTEDVIRQTRSHLFDTGEDPYAAFGDPSDYAKHYAPHSTTTRFWVLIIGSVLLATTGGWILVNGIINYVGARSILWGVNPLVGIIVGGVVTAIWIVALVVVVARHARQGESRR